MGKKKRGHPDLEEILARPWCYYCERDFDDLKILISHQKAKHFRCERCGKRLNTAGGLSVHMSQVHKEQLTAIENALPNRAGLDVEIFGMEGVPEDVIQAHNQRVLTQFQQAEAERRAATGNPAPGGSSGNQPKKPRLESPADLKKRLAEHKAKLAERAAGGSSGDATPVGAGQSMQTPTGYAQPTQYAAAQQPFSNAAPPAPNQQYSYPQPYGGAVNSPFQAAAASPVYQNYSPNGQQQYPPPTQYTSPGISPAPYTAAVYGNTPPPMPYAQQQQQPSRTQTPPQNVSSLPTRPPSLPSAPGLPQRPPFSAPPVNAAQMQQMHHGQLPTPPQPAAPGAYGQPPAANGAQPSGAAPVSSSVDDLISGAAKEAEQAAQPDGTKAEAAEEKPAKKEKDKSKPTRMVYADNETSPEEKMARLPRYAFVLDRKPEMVLVEGITPAVSGVVTTSDDIIDRSG
ncbi:hypothetical protein DTO207G8_4034 [Paecilomyces variotii]|nr:hypothetical protein DTO169E5_7732 [Paecilomyces variotii]KAJ9253610.1 hypothetical protein DTO207G8_4034 [Paecilomyces variotii]